MKLNKVQNEIIDLLGAKSMTAAEMREVLGQGKFNHAHINRLEAAGLIVIDK